MLLKIGRQGARWTDQMQEEVRLFRTLKEREEIDILADLYSIFMATEGLEKAYIRDIARSEEYLGKYCTTYC